MAMNHFKIKESAAPSKVRRFATVALPAGTMTVALFLAMQHLVQAEDVSPPKQTVYDVQAFMDVVPGPEPTRATIRLKKLDPVDPPPRPPALVKDIEIVNLSDAGYGGAAPADYGAADLEMIKPSRITSIADRTMIPITPPVPLYPRRAETLGVEGTCDVHLNVSTRGDPFDVRANCTDPVFESAARKAVQKVKFAPQIRDGLPVTVIGVVYPLEFKLKP